MLTIIIPAVEAYDNVKEEFIILAKEQTLQLEHSLVSISKWESTWCKPFLSKTKKTTEESLDYIKCMTITKNVEPTVYDNITSQNIAEVTAYIDAPMTATTFRKEKNTPHGEIPTAEVIYQQMIALQIPFSCEKWHLNKLLTLIRVCNIKNNPPKKMSQKELMSRNAALNASRRAAMNTNG